jgi:hypothetical protein
MVCWLAGNRMGRMYAGILGALAFLLVLGRGLIHGADLETTARVACTGLVVMALVGAVVGRLAAWFIEQSICWQIQGELDARPQTRDEARRTNGGQQQ